MSVTVLGWIIIPLSLIFLFLPIKYCVYITLGSSVFQAGAVLIFGESTTITPFLYCISIFILRVFEVTLTAKHPIRRCPWTKISIFLYAYSWIIALLAPKIFGEISVLTSSWGRSYSSLREVSANHSFLNYISIAAYFVALWAFFQVRDAVTYEKLLKCIYVCFIIVVSTGIIYIIFRKMDIDVSFLNKLLYSDVYSQMSNSTEALNISSSLRLYGPYKEASYCGGFLAPFFAAIFFVENKSIGETILLVLCGVSIILNASSTGIVVALVGVLYYYVMTKNLKRHIAVLFGGIIVFLVGFTYGYGETIDKLIFKKLQSSSGVQRSLMNSACLDVFFRSKGLGVGINNVRASSFAINMLGQIGIIGSTLLVILIIRVMRSASENQTLELVPKEKTRRFCFVFMEMSLVSQILSEPDIFLSTFWFSLYCVVLVSPTYYAGNTKRRIRISGRRKLV